MKMSFSTKFLLFMAIVCLCNANEYGRDRKLRNAPERVSAASRVDQSQLDRLDSIENKLSQFNSSAIENLVSIQVKQQKTSNQLDKLEQMHRNVYASVGSIRNEIDTLRSSMESIKDDSHYVAPRQADFGASAINETISLSNKLDSLSVLLFSTHASVVAIEKTLSQFDASLTRLTQLTRATQKRLSNSRPQFAQQPQYPQIFGQPQPSPEYASTEPSSCAQAFLPKKEIQKLRIYPQSELFYALCESGDDGGWTIIQNRFDGSINFNRGWEEYKNGFGNLAGEFFIGLEKLHALTASNLHELMIVLVDFKGVQKYASYSSFAIAGERESYTLQILGKYSGDAGDSFSFQAGNKFSTYDNDNDGWVEGNCAHAHTGAWWYAACEKSNLNGQYLTEKLDKSQYSQGMYWETFNGALSSLKAVQMKIRPVDQGDGAN